MSIRNTGLIAAVLIVAAGASLSADRVRLRSGQVVEGTFLGGDSRVVRMLLANGSRVQFPVGDIMRLEFTARTPPPQATAPASAPSPAAAPPPVTVPGGTVVNVRLTQDIDVDASQAGMKFKGLVDDPVMLSGKVVIPRGAAAVLEAVQVEQSGKMKGSDKITLKVNAIQFGGRSYEVATQYVETKGKGEGKKTTRKVVGGVGLGAVSGASLEAGRGPQSAHSWAARPERSWRAPVRSTSAFLPRPACSSS